MARRRIRKEIFLVKPSELPKDSRAYVRINDFIKKLLKSEGVSVQKILDDALDKKFHKVEFEKKITVEPKKQ